MNSNALSKTAISEQPLLKENRFRLIQRLSRIIEETLRSLIASGEKCALLDFPNYANVGDSAIWLGEVNCLRKIGVKVAFASDIVNHSSELLLEKVSNGTIILSGGGNLGDLWPGHQKFRETIIETFPNHRIVQLPQSIYFKNTENLKRAKKIFNQHPNFTLLVRNQESFNFAKNEFKCQVLLCPDMAYALGPLSLAVGSRKRGLALLRSDCESALNDYDLPAEFDKSDWIEDDFSLKLIIYKQAFRLCGEFPNRLRNVSSFLSNFYNTVARIRLARGCDLLSRYKCVVTDRLHARILCILLGIPHVCLDNSNGKLRGSHETWTHSLDSTHWAESLNEAFKLAQSLNDDRND